MEPTFIKRYHNNNLKDSTIKQKAYNNLMFDYILLYINFNKIHRNLQKIEFCSYAAEICKKWLR